MFHGFQLDRFFAVQQRDDAQWCALYALEQQTLGSPSPDNKISAIRVVCAIYTSENHLIQP